MHRVRHWPVYRQTSLPRELKLTTVYQIEKAIYKVKLYGAPLTAFVT